MLHIFSFGISERVRGAPLDSVVLRRPILLLRMMDWDGAALWPCTWFLKTLKVGNVLGNDVVSPIAGLPLIPLRSASGLEGRLLIVGASCFVTSQVYIDGCFVFLK